MEIEKGWYKCIKSFNKKWNQDGDFFQKHLVYYLFPKGDIVLILTKNKNVLKIKMTNKDVSSFFKPYRKKVKNV